MHMFFSSLKSGLYVFAFPLLYCFCRGCFNDQPRQRQVPKQKPQLSCSKELSQVCFTKGAPFPNIFLTWVDFFLIAQQQSYNLSLALKIGTKWNKRVQEVTNRTIRNVPYQLKVLDKSVMDSQHFVLRQQLSIFNCEN